MSVDKATVGLIGLGLMGSAMLRRFAGLGYPVVGYDAVAARTDAWAKQMVSRPAGPADVAAAADVVIMCVTSTQCVEDAVFGTDGLASSAGKQSIIVDLSTTVADTTRALAERLRAETGAGWVDAPVSGGPPAAEAGKLAIMAGGEASDFERARPLLEHLGSVTLMGPVGAGQVTKMLNQVLVLTKFCIFAEAVRLGEKAGIDVAKVPEALAGGYADGPMFRNFWPKLLARDFAPQGFARQVLKDLDMVDALARSVQAPTPMSDQARSLFRLLVARGYAELDATAVLKLYDDPPV